MEKSQNFYQKDFINRTLIELKRRPDKLQQVKLNLYRYLQKRNLPRHVYRHLDQLKWVLEMDNVHVLEDWLNHSERNPVGYQNWALAFQNVT